MSELNDDGVDSTLESQEDVDLDTTSEEEVDWKAEALKAKELANNYKTRAEKAEGKIKESKPAEKVVTATTHTLEDQMALLKADVAVEDISVVTDYAKFKGISIVEALKSGVVKAELAEKRELRATAAASNVGGAKRASNQVSDDALLENARNGKMPESAAEIERLNRIRRGQK